MKSTPQPSSLKTSSITQNARGILSNRLHFSSILTARDDSRCCRHIIVRQTLDPNETYYVRFKSVLDSDKKELYMDYMEWCPKEVYDNPSKPEDVW